MSDECDRYNAALEHVRYEGQLLWQIFGAFLLAHTIFLAFLLPSAAESARWHSAPAVFWPCVVGLTLCVPWFATYFRSSAYYMFRMAQAAAAEPSGWNLLKGDGQRFSDGEEVVMIGEKPYRPNWIARHLRTRRSVPMMIWAFVVLYGFLAISSGPWMTRKERAAVASEAPASLLRH